MATKFRDIVATVAPHGKTVLINGFSDAFLKYAKQFDMTTNARVTNFIAQCAEETNGFNSFEEYASGKAYEGRADLGNTSPGDGEKYKGRGILMTTGKGNYKTVSREIYGDDRLLDSPADLANDYDLATLAALHFWKDHNLNAVADMPDDHVFTVVHKDGTKTNYNKLQYITRAINGGQNGIEVRALYFQRAIASIKDFIKNNPALASIILLVVAAVFLTVIISK